MIDIHLENEMTETKRTLPNEKKPKLTDAERHERFLDMARKVGASTKREDFDKAVMKVAGKGRVLSK
jgi:hypothetical protein